ncbi:MAG: hypothetical protein WCK89_13010 [bacterium]
MGVAAVIIAVFVLSVGGLRWFIGTQKEGVTSDKRSAAGTSGVPTNKTAGLNTRSASTKHAGHGDNKSAPGAVIEDDDALVRKVLAPLQADLDSNDPKVIAAAARKIMGHANAKVRLQAVESLAWTEVAGFADLSKMLSDPDPEVSLAAFEAWAQQVQMIESSETKVALLKEVGGVALNKGAEAFQEVLSTLNDVPANQALALLQNFASKTDDLEMLEAIYDSINFHASPDENVKSKEDIPKAIEEFNRRQAEEAAAEAAAAVDAAVRAAAGSTPKAVAQ